MRKGYRAAGREGDGRGVRFRKGCRAQGWGRQGGKGMGGG